jgi:hypothetical protein
MKSTLLVLLNYHLELMYVADQLATSIMYFSDYNEKYGNTAKESHIKNKKLQNIPRRLLLAHLEQLVTSITNRLKGTPTLANSKDRKTSSILQKNEVTNLICEKQPSSAYIKTWLCEEGRICGGLQMLRSAVP